MQISNSINSPLTSGVSNPPLAPIKNSVPTAESVSDIEQNKPSDKQVVPSIVIDEQAVALYQQSQAVQIPVQSKQEGASSASQDQPSAKNETAVASYQTVGNLAKRESVQQLFGVDLFA